LTGKLLFASMEMYPASDTKHEEIAGTCFSTAENSEQNIYVHGI
jgi:hypothetical protein